MFPGNITALFFNFNKIILLFQKSEGKYSECNPVKQSDFLNFQTASNLTACI